MSDIQLTNRDGKIVGIDTETGEEVPVEMGDLAPDSVKTDEQHNTGGTVRANIATDSDGTWTEQYFTSIQDAADAIPSPEQGAKGYIQILPLGGGPGMPSYDESISVNDKRMIIEGFGPSSQIRPSGGVTQPAVELTNSDDGELRHVWVDNPWSNNTTDGDAIQGDGSEIILNRINVDRAGRYAINLDGPRMTIKQSEIKAGDYAAVRLSGSQSRIQNTVIHDELGHGIPRGIVFGEHGRIKLNTVWIMLNDATDVFEYETPARKQPQWSNVYIGPSPQVNGNVSNDVQFKGRDGKAFNVVIKGTGAQFFDSVDFDFYGYIEGGVSNWGTRAAVNGVGINPGNPSTTGDWNDYAAKAHARGVHTVWDTSVDPPAAYEPHPDAGTGAGWRSKNYTAP